MKSNYFKFSDERSREYSIETRFEETESIRKVIKSAIYPQGKKHLQNIIRYAEVLSKAYPNVRVCPVEEKNGELYFDYIDGELLSSSYAETAEKRDQEQFYQLLKKHRDIILGGKENQTIFVESDESRKWFGNLSQFDGQSGLKVSNFDAIAGNIIMRENQPVFIDYEWVFECVLPTDLVVYHCVSDEYLHNEKLAEVVSLEDALMSLGIKQNISELHEAYKHFFRMVVCDADGKSFADMKFLCLKQTKEDCKDANLKLEEKEKEIACLSAEVSGLKKELNKTLDYWKQSSEANRNYEKELQKMKSVFGQFGNAEEVQRLLAEKDAQLKAYDEVVQHMQKVYNPITKSLLWRGARKIKRIIKK